ncbi:MAG TPA: glycosyltransferase family 4 protein [Thermoanaerobaculia bacterium]|nr:glycosyltransferase family 4 protein [Thermoanaerobaculia bacterium]HUM28874.1 glycosyltransferase family 4 protein [Thermoanaerobaculia bacterium]HXK67193.1 glycosyltransferase family 4 protein [Thermoanaerobaculia bacterium]
MRILFCLEYFPPHIGGVEQMMYDLTRALVQEGHEVRIVTSRVEDTRAKETMDGVEVYRIRCPKPMRLTFNLLAIPALFRHAPWADLIHCSTFNGVFPAWLVSRLRGKPLVGTVHEVWLHLPEVSPRVSWFMKKIYPLAQRVLLKRRVSRWVTVSWSTRQALRLAGVSDDKIRQVYNPVDVRPPADWNDTRREVIRNKLNIGDRFAFLYFGRPGVWRGVEYLIRGFHLLPPDRKAVLILVLSRKPMSGYTLCQTLAERGDRNDTIFFQSSMPRGHLIETILAADCVVVPSLSEGFGLIAAEASSLGIPVLASDVASLPEVVGGKSILVPPADPEILQNAMVDAMEGRWDNRPPRNFPLKDTVLGYLEVYREILYGKYFRGE